MRLAIVSAIGSLKGFWYWVTYRIAMWKHGLSDPYIRRAFSALTELDIDEFGFIPELHLELKAWGNEVHLKVRGTVAVEWLPNHPKLARYATKVGPGIAYECVIKEGIRAGELYVDEWREETREVILELGTRHETHWWEVYRSGKWIRSTLWADYLHLLYGDGKCSPVKSSKDTSSQTTSLA